jgi:hypothetical protein
MKKIALILALLATPAFAAVAINEIDYQNPGSDSTEWVELVGVAGTDLSGWTLELVNGANGLAYNTVALSGSIPNDFTSDWGGDGGFFVVGAFDATTAASFGSPDLTPAGWSSNEIQNGGDDIIRLYDGLGTLIDEIEYDDSDGISVTGGSEPYSGYDGAGTGGDITSYSSIGRRGYSFDSPMFVFDDPDANLFGQSLNDRYDHENNAQDSGTGPFGAYTEASGSEWYWSGTSAFGAGRGITPGAFNGASYGTAGMQDTYTINIVPEPATALLLGLGALFLRRRRA